MSPEVIKKRIKVIRAIHYTILWLFFVSMYLMMFSPVLGIYGAVAMLGMGVVQYRNAGLCPLTLEEQKAARRVGGSVEHDFVKGVFKKHFNLDVPRYFINTFFVIGYVLSIYVFVVYLLSIFKSV
jgi:hypothetical protein